MLPDLFLKDFYCPDDRFNLCFQQFLMETRNSAELSASQQDMAADDFDILPDVNLTVGLKAGVTKRNRTGGLSGSVSDQCQYST